MEVLGSSACTAQSGHQFRCSNLLQVVVEMQPTLLELFSGGVGVLQDSKVHAEHFSLHTGLKVNGEHFTLRAGQLIFYTM